MDQRSDSFHQRRQRVHVNHRCFSCRHVSHNEDHLIGNEILAEEGALIDLKACSCSFKSAKGNIPIVSIKSTVLPASQPSARLQQVFTIKPGPQSRVPIALTSVPPTALYLLEPVQVSDDIKVARTIGLTDQPAHYAHVMNVESSIVKVPANIILANVKAVKDTRSGKIASNNIALETADDREAFNEALQEVDVNMALTEEEKESLRGVLRQNRQAFSYGSKRLG